MLQRRSVPILAAMLVQTADRRISSVILFLAAVVLVIYISNPRSVPEPAVAETQKPIDQTDGRTLPIITPIDPVWPIEPSEAVHAVPPVEDKPWKFNATEHERDYGLSNEQCNTAFPELGVNIDSVVNHRRASGLITESVVDKSFVNEGGAELARVLIYDRQVSVPMSSGVAR